MDLRLDFGKNNQFLGGLAVEIIETKKGRQMAALLYAIILWLSQRNTFESGNFNFAIRCYMLGNVSFFVFDEYLV